MRLTVRLMERAPRVQSGLVARYGLGALAPVVVIVALLGLGATGHAQAALANSSDHTVMAKVRGAKVTSPASADVFMQAIITHNGQLAWQQLCPTLQQKLPATELANLVNVYGGPDQGMQLGVDFVGAHPWADGGDVRVYVVTAHGPAGADFRSLYVLRTQASGCIDGILGG